MVRDRVLNHALRQAFGEQIPAGRYPCYVLYLTLPADQVDVNVHPTKHEVRFHQTRQVHDFIVSRLQKALTAADLAQGMAFAEPSVYQAASAAHYRPAPLGAPLTSNDTINRYSLSTSVSSTQAAVANVATPPAQQPSSDVQIVYLQRPHWLLLQEAEGLWLVDLRYLQAHQRWQRWQQGRDEGNLTSQPLLLPIHLDRPKGESSQWQRYLEALAAWGWQLALGADDLQVRQAPVVLRGVDMQRLMVALLAQPELLNPQAETMKALVWPFLLQIKLPEKLYAQAERWLVQFRQHHSDLAQLGEGARRLMASDFEQLMAATHD